MSDSIVIGFSRPKGKFKLFADAIMLMDRSNFSHVYIRFHADSYDRDLVYQASGTQVNFMGWERFQSHAVIVKEFTLPISVDAKVRLVQFCIDNVGAPYALAEAIGISVVKFASLFGKKISNPVSQKGYFCSEMAAIILTDFFAASLKPEDANKMTPTDVYNYLLAHPVEAAQ